MVSAATLDDLNRFADAGRLHLAQVRLVASELRPHAGDVVEVQWSVQGAEGAVWLSLGAQPLTQVPHEGRRQMPVGAEPVAVEVRCEGGQDRLVIEPWIVVPAIDLMRASHVVTLGESVALTWRTRDATAVELEIREGLEARRIGVQAAGRFELPARRMGRMEIRLTARGADLAHSPDATAIRAITIEVQAPPVRIAVPAELRGLPGEAALLRWCVTGASQVRLQRPSWGEVMRAPLQGAAEIELDGIEEQIRLIATGLDQAEHTALVRLKPTIADLPSISAELDGMTLHHNLP